MAMPDAKMPTREERIGKAIEQIDQIHAKTINRLADIEKRQKQLLQNVMDRVAKNKISDIMASLKDQ